MRLIVFALVCIVLSLPVARPAVAANDVQSGQAASSSAPARSEVGVIDRFTIWVLNEQRAFHRKLTGHLRDLARSDNWQLVWPLVIASFLYGLFHAAGPGHGKAVVSSYLLSHRKTMRLGIALAAAAAFLQGLVAIVIVYGLVALAGWVPRDAQAAVLWSERASFALVALLGAFLLLRAVRRLRARWRGGHAGGHNHAHEHDHGGHDDCGHAHVPTARDVASVHDLKSALAVILSVGIRPCSGAVIVLVFANVAALPWAGIAAVAAMSAGTAMAVSALAAFAVSARAMIARMSWLDGSRAALAADLAALAGGLVILAVGLTLLQTAFGPAHPILGM